MLRQRLLTAAIAVPLVVAAISFAPRLLMALLVAALGVIGFRELDRLARAQGVATFALSGSVLTAVLILSPALSVRSAAELAALAITAAFLVVMIRVVIVPRPLAEALPSAGATLLGILWVGLMLSYVPLLGAQPHGPGQLYTLLFAVWGSDSGAYVVGRAFGRHKLAPRLSPGKTREGLAGGLAGAVGGVALGANAFGLGVPLGVLDTILLGLLLGAVATLGDLAESALKRGAGVKDSGAIFPGHGGVLDRLDSLLFAAPVMYHYLYTVRALLPAAAAGSNLTP